MKTDPDPFANCTVIRTFGNAKPTDQHTASTIRAVDNEIFKILQKREQRQRKPRVDVRGIELRI
jgi:hypothetical protein